MTSDPLEEASERKTLLISFADSSVSRARSSIPPLSPLSPLASDCHATTRFRMPIKLTSLRQEETIARIETNRIRAPRNTL